ncbi:Trans-aconitate 3-methyltransferase [Grifola frondosa]|uniref:Trans-aconitate 3-methyltransferase n=1 Tax=Grifola frondosa TaxID=5627 RepID=A0A1C7MTT9_GRIFR|nr:Trans-aconitate 3-methyltransferase [Grifola frondosa]
MATFGKATFNAAKYASGRPTYPRQLFDFVFRFHERAPGARWDTAVDLGCGTGQATVELTPFKRVIGVDPSARMIEQAREGAKAGPGGLDVSSRVEFVQSSAERLGFLEDGSVDLIIAAQAAHWFDWAKLWPEAARVLRRDGTLAVWGYSEFRLSRYPSATPLIHAYMQGADPTTSLGPYWEQPGRAILDDHLLAIPDATQVVPGAFREFTRVFFTGAHDPGLPDARPVILRKTMTWAELMEYLRTASALHTFLERNPEDMKHPDGDIAVRAWKGLKAEAARQDGKDVVRSEEEALIFCPNATLVRTTTAGAPPVERCTFQQNLGLSDELRQKLTETCGAGSARECQFVSDIDCPD